MSSDLSVDRFSTLSYFDLQVNGETYPLTQIAPNFIVFKRPVELPPCEATIVIHSDGERSECPVRLVKGAGLDSDLAEIERA